MPETVGDNIHVYCGGEYARRMLAQHRPAYESDVLLYTSQDFRNKTGDVKEFQLSAGEGKMVFLLIGTLEERNVTELDNIVTAVEECEARVY